MNMNCCSVVVLGNTFSEPVLLPKSRSKHSGGFYQIREEVDKEVEET